MSRIAQVTWYDPANFPPVLNAGRVLVAAGHEVSCLGVFRGGRSSLEHPAKIDYRYQNDPPGAYAKSFGARIWEAARFRHYVQRQLDRLHPDMIIAYDHWGLWASHARSRRGRLVYHILDILDRSRIPWLSRERLVSMAANRALHRCDLLVVPERRRLDYLKRQMTIPVPSTVVANVPLLSKLDKRETSFKEMIARQSGEYPQFLIVFVGNMGLYAETIRAVAALDSRWHLSVIGLGSAAARRQMEADAVANGVAKRCHFFEYTPYDTVRQWLRSCDVGLAFYPDWGVNWRLAGTASVKAMEYMAAAMPTLVLRGSGFDDLTAREAATEIVAPTAAAIADALRTLEPGTAAYARKSSAAYAAHVSEYNCERQMGPILRLLE